jgi:hypothetical protein
MRSVLAAVLWWRQLLLDVNTDTVDTCACENLSALYQNKHAGTPYPCIHVHVAPWLPAGLGLPAGSAAAAHLLAAALAAGLPGAGVFLAPAGLALGSV